MPAPVRPRSGVPRSGCPGAMVRAGTGSQSLQQQIEAVRPNFRKHLNLRIVLKDVVGPAGDFQDVRDVVSQLFLGPAGWT